MSTSTISASDLAGRLGLKRYPRSWRGNCPACDYPGAFALKRDHSDRPKMYCANGCDRDTLDDTLQRRLGEAWRPTEKPANTDLARARAAKQAAALRLWAGSAPAPGTLSERYLKLRGIGEVARSRALRFRADCQHPGHGRHPALIALVQDVAGEPVAVHRTYIDPVTGRKAAIEPPKASLGPVWGSGIRLSPIQPGIPLAIGEGIESSAAAGRLMALPAWAALSAGNLAAGLVLPPEIRRIVIAADHDVPVKNGARPGQEAAQAAARRWRKEGRYVEIAIPDRAGHDFADVLMEHPHGC